MTPLMLEHLLHCHDTANGEPIPCQSDNQVQESINQLLMLGLIEPVLYFDEYNNRYYKITARGKLHVDNLCSCCLPKEPS